ncbi:MAG: hypothetical protein JHD16_17955 [Solirubrobacteraceae bacterium]|nr:hypothetical protein [Solirubrobacteraceae bacterium]
MTSRPQHAAARITAAAMLAATLTFTSAAPALAKPKPTVVKPCKPGAIKKVKTKSGHADTYVCDSKGKWVRVVAIMADGGTVAEDAQAEPAAERALKPKVDPKATRCMVAGGVFVDVGDVVVETSYVKDENGNTVSITHRKYLCGADGQLHEVFAITAGPQTPTKIPGGTR